MGSPTEIRDPLRSFRPDAERLACSLSAIRTPALLIDEATVAANIETAMRLIGSAGRWRAHCKTAKSERTMSLLLKHGVRYFKGSTTTEVASLLRAGARDVLFAIPTVGPAHRELMTLARRYPECRVHALLDSDAALQSWSSGSMGFFLDVDTGMNRTGVPVSRPDDGLALIERASALGFEFSGLHHYDGHLAYLPEPERTQRTRQGLALLSGFALALGIDVPEIVTGGSHTFLPALEYDFPEPLADGVKVGPGTIVYCDLRSLERLGEVGLRPAAGVLCRAISAPTDNTITVDAGFTAIQVDAGTPHAAVSGASSAVVGMPSQEHLVIRYEVGRPDVGELVLLVPLHIDTAIAQFDHYLAISESNEIHVYPVSARAHPDPLPTTGHE